MAGSALGTVVSKAVTALAADTTLVTALGTAKVYTAVPDDTAAPYLVVEGGQEVLWSPSFDDLDGRQTSVEVTAHSTYQGTSQVDSLADLIISRLTTAGTWSGLTGYQTARYERSERPERRTIHGQVQMTRRVVVTVWSIL